jgi:hypothetical protein
MSGLAMVRRNLEQKLGKGACRLKLLLPLLPPQPLLPCTKKGFLGTRSASGKSDLGITSFRRDGILEADDVYIFFFRRR